MKVYKTRSYDQNLKALNAVSIVLITLFLFTSSVLSAALITPVVTHSNDNSEGSNADVHTNVKSSSIGMVHTPYADDRQDKETPSAGPSDLRQIQYSFLLQNKTNRFLEKAEFWTYAPAKETATQRTVKIETSHPHKIITDDLGNQILYFHFENMPPYATKIITVKASVELYSIPNQVSEENLQIFLQPEKYIESDNP